MKCCTIKKAVARKAAASFIVVALDRDVVQKRSMVMNRTNRKGREKLALDDERECDQR